MPKQVAKISRYIYELLFILTDLDKGIEVYSNVAKLSKSVPKDKAGNISLGKKSKLSDKEFETLHNKCYNDDIGACNKLIKSHLVSVLECGLDEGQSNCRKLGSIFRGAKEYAKAREYYERGVALGDSHYYNDLGVLELREQNTQQARKYYKLGCEAGDVDYACFNLAMDFLVDNPSKQEQAQILTYCQIVYEKSSITEKRARCALNMGGVYELKYQVSKSINDANKVASYLKLSCDLKAGEVSAVSCATLGRMYRDGEDSLKVKPSRDLANEYFANACNLGNKESCDTLNEMQKLDKAFDACWDNDTNHADSCKWLIDSGEAFRRYGDLSTCSGENCRTIAALYSRANMANDAIPYDKKACDKNLVADSCFYVASSYEDNGDIKNAILYYKKALNNPKIDNETKSLTHFRLGWIY